MSYSWPLYVYKNILNVKLCIDCSGAKVNPLSQGKRHNSQEKICCKLADKNSASANFEVDAVQDLLGKYHWSNATYCINCTYAAKYSHIANASDNPVLMELPDFLTLDNNVLQTSKEIEVHTTHLSVVTWPIVWWACPCLKVSERMQIVDTTRGQHNNPEWHDQRLGVIIASRAHCVISLVSEASHRQTILYERSFTQRRSSFQVLLWVGAPPKGCVSMFPGPMYPSHMFPDTYVPQ